jgi:hypothetical protein
MVLKIDRSARKLDPRFKRFLGPTEYGVCQIFLFSSAIQCLSNRIDNLFEQELHRDG